MPAADRAARPGDRLPPAGKAAQASTAGLPIAARSRRRRRAGPAAAPGPRPPPRLVRRPRAVGPTACHGRPCGPRTRRSRRSTVGARAGPVLAVRRIRPHSLRRFPIRAPPRARRRAGRRLARRPIGAAPPADALEPGVPCPSSDADVGASPAPACPRARSSAKSRASATPTRRAGPAHPAAKPPTHRPALRLQPRLNLSRNRTPEIDDPFAGLDSLEAEMAKLLGREKRN